MYTPTHANHGHSNILARTDALPTLKEQLADVKIKSPIEQHMRGRSGLFRQQNVEKRRVMSVREWAELCAREEFRAPGVREVGLHARSHVPTRKPKKEKKKVDAQTPELAEPETAIGPKRKDEDEMDVDGINDVCVDATHEETSPLVKEGDSTVLAATSSTPIDTTIQAKIDEDEALGTDGEALQNTKAKRAAQNREIREANLAERAARDADFLNTFDPHKYWLPPDTAASDYTFEFCQKLERQYWRNCSLGKPPWYGADTLGLFDFARLYLRI